MSDIVERLRERAKRCEEIQLDEAHPTLMWEAAAEIERLTGREAELRIQALGAAISRRDWHAVEQAHAAIRDALEPKP